MTESVDLEIAADDAASLIERSLNALLDGALSPAGGGADPTLSIGIRAEASTLDALLVELSESLIAGLDHGDYLVAEIRIDGVLRTDDGLTAWGYALSVPATNDATAARPIRSIERAEITRDPAGHYRARLTVRAAALTP